jgi:hypothetical protein
MLKRAGHILIILLLLLGTTGVTITRHYCGVNLVRTSLYSAPHNCCNENCPRCHDERIDVRITDNFQSSQSQINFTAGFKDLLKEHTLPIVLLFSQVPDLDLLYNDRRDHCLKPSPLKQFHAGDSTAFLQVFLV